MSDPSISPPSSPSLPRHALERSSSSVDSGQPVAGSQRTAGVLRTILPHLLRLLPLLDGNVGSAVSNLLSSPQPAPPPPPPVNLEPIKTGLARIQVEHSHLHAQLSDQSASLKRVEDRLEQVEETSAHTSLAQQELLNELKTASHQQMEALKAAGHKMNVFALLALGLFTLSIVLNVILFLYLRRVLH